MAYTTNVTQAAMLTQLQSNNAGLSVDACNTILTSLGNGVQAAIGSPILVNGMLVKCTQGYGTPSAQTALVFAYDATPA